MEGYSDLVRYLRSGLAVEELHKKVSVHLRRSKDPLSVSQIRTLIRTYDERSRLGETAWIIGRVRRGKGAGLSAVRIEGLAYGAILRGELGVAEEVAGWLRGKKTSPGFALKMVQGWCRAGEVERAREWQDRLVALASPGIGQAWVNGGRMAIMERMLQRLRVQTRPFNRREEGLWEGGVAGGWGMLEREWAAVARTGHVGVGPEGWGLWMQASWWAHGWRGVERAVSEMWRSRRSVVGAGDAILRGRILEGDMWMARKVYLQLDRMERRAKREEELPSRQLVRQGDVWRRHEWFALGYLRAGNTRGWEAAVRGMREGGWEGSGSLWTGVIRWAREEYGPTVAHDILRRVEHGEGWGELGGGRPVRLRADALAEVVWGYVREGGLAEAQQAITEWRGEADGDGRMRVWHALIWGYTRWERGVFPPGIEGMREVGVVGGTAPAAILPVPVAQLEHIAANPAGPFRMERRMRTTMMWRASLEGRAALVLGILRGMEGWERDEGVYSVVMELYAEKGDVVGTRRLLKVMQETYGRVGIKAWEALIRAYVASGHVRGAERVLKEMAWEGKVIGGERAWNMVLQGWMGEANAEEEVRRVWRMMQSRGIEGSHRSLRMLNEVLAKERGGMWNELS